MSSPNEGKFLAPNTELRHKFQAQFKRQTQNMDLMRALQEMQELVAVEKNQLNEKNRYTALHALVQEVIDNIYHEQSIEFKENIQLLQKHLKVWVARNEEPSNLEVSVLQKKEKILKEKERDEALNPLHEDLHKIIEEQTKEICSKYGIQIKQFTETVGYQIDRFCNNDNAFLLFKKKATRNEEYQKRMAMEYLNKNVANAPKKMSTLDKFKSASKKYLLKQQSQSMLDDIEKSPTNQRNYPTQVRPKNNFTVLKDYQKDGGSSMIGRIDNKLLITNDSHMNFQTSHDKSYSTIHNQQSIIKLPQFNNSYQVSPVQNKTLMQNQSQDEMTQDPQASQKKLRNPYRKNGKSLSVDHSIMLLDAFTKNSHSQQPSPQASKSPKRKNPKIHNSVNHTVTQLPSIRRKVMNFSNNTSRQNLLQSKKDELKNLKKSLDLETSPENSAFKEILSKNTMNMMRKSQGESYDRSKVNESQAVVNIKNILMNCSVYEEEDRKTFRAHEKPIMSNGQTKELTLGTDSRFLSPNKYNFIDEQLLQEKLKAQNFVKLSKDLKKLQQFKPQMLKALFSESKNSYYLQCETEKQCMEQYMIKKMDTRIQKMLEFKTKKR
ncbi:UNKNOWN [Stylonychia lemnae]|uniref:Uncharacterized protein n=1 Tax=Stylonychia lemnae TaxID=5949 RepID=A0A078B2N0_STYLE|nr:UNKNOWN [Stylonychia lemnae]|eukprot:CDW87743.1 UNKNOWN [Stylonychia lemnae]